MKTKTIGLSVLAILSLLVVFSGCSGAFGGDSLNIYVGELDNGRYISSNADSGYVIVAKKDKIFSIGSLSGYSQAAFEYGYLSIKGLPVGDYTLIVVLIDDDDPLDGQVAGEAVGFKAQDITIERGPNYVPVLVGPGFTEIRIGGTDYVELLYNPTKARSFPDVSFYLGTDTVYISGTGILNPDLITLSWSEGTPGAPTNSGTSRTFSVTSGADLNSPPAVHSFTVTLLD